MKTPRGKTFIMMKYLISFVFLSFMLVACNQGSSTTENSEVRTVKDKEADNILHRLPTLHVEDTVKSGNNVYSWIIHREASDSLAIVTDEMGYRFVDNLLKISVRKNGSLLFSHTFKKADFRHLLPADFAKQSILDGCRFMQIHEGMVTFSLAVSYPESDMSRPFKLNIGPDGSYVVVKNDDMEEEYSSDEP